MKTHTITNGCIADFNDLIESFIKDTDVKITVKSITENYPYFSKSITFTTKLTKKALLEIESVRNLADSFNGRIVR